MEIQQTGLFFKVPAQALWRVIPQPVLPHWSAHRFITHRMRRKPERPGRTKFEAALGVPGVNGHRDKYVFSLRMEWIHSSVVCHGMMVIRHYKDTLIWVWAEQIMQMKARWFQWPEILPSPVNHSSFLLQMTYNLQFHHF